MNHSSESTSPPTKASLKAWWNNFTAPKKKAEIPAEPAHPVFGKPLKETLKYASVQISTANANGELYVWGVIPIVVAKCGLYLKENATETEGTFRINGSTKRMRELQALFETPPRYGKELNWKQESYTTHDVASVFRRYLTQMPEPVIPHGMYHHFRDALEQQPNTTENVIATYKKLIREMPRVNQYLLLYVLDLLSVFARKSDKNLMTATNLAVIFRPGFISHPTHEMSPNEHMLSQRVLEFLIAQQDWFMLDIPPPPPQASTTFASEEDIVIEPSSDDDPSSSGGGWKLVNKNRIDRRKTMRNVEHDVEQGGAVSRSPSGVSRSRTLPTGSRRGGRPSDSPTPTERKLLKKQHRSSSQPKRIDEQATPG